MDFLVDLGSATTGLSLLPMEKLTLNEPFRLSFGLFRGVLFPLTWDDGDLAVSFYIS